MKYSMLFLFFLILACHHTNQKEENSLYNYTVSNQSVELMSVTEFLEMTAINGQMKVKLDQLAMNRTKNEEVRALSELLIRDHSRSNNELMTLINVMNIRVEPILDNEHKKMIAFLEDAENPDFDQTYLQMMIDIFENSIEEFKTYNSYVRDKHLDAWMNDRLEMFNNHLSQARKIQQEL